MSRKVKIGWFAAGGFVAGVALMSVIAGSMATNDYSKYSKKSKTVNSEFQKFQNNLNSYFEKSAQVNDKIEIAKSSVPEDKLAAKQSLLTTIISHYLRKDEFKKLGESFNETIISQLNAYKMGHNFANRKYLKTLNGTKFDETLKKMKEANDYMSKILSHDDLKDISF